MIKMIEDQRKYEEIMKKDALIEEKLRLMKEKQDKENVYFFEL